MDSVEDNVMVSVLPDNDDWCKIDPPHTTLVYVGKVKDLDPLVRDLLIKAVSSIAILTNPFRVKVIGRETFGDSEPVDVFTLAGSSDRMALRALLDSWDDGEFPIYRPHATIGPVGSLVKNPPTFLLFDRIMIGWGEERLTFWFKRFRR